MAQVNRLHRLTDDLKMIAAVLKEFPHVGISVYECSDGKIFRLSIEQDLFKVALFVEDLEAGHIRGQGEEYEEILEGLKKLSKVLLGRVVC